ncbi:MAG: anhydro-N-acetylmuramic acid kinase [Spirochaetia bacterium]|nr:anhydro-N-acetylmuramic acid kinase [Spirochaetia bacterium]
MNEKKATPHILHSYAAKKEHLIIGLMSGTSLDGVDAVLVHITQSGGEQFTLKHHYYLPYSKGMREKISRVCRVPSSHVNEILDVHFGLSHWYAKAVNNLLIESGYKATSIDAISMHGQTVWHSPVATPFPGPDGEFGVTGTLQLGNASVLAKLTDIPVISDFRSADMAVGGEGAPLAPYSDFMMFGSTQEGRIIQNIGGIGNATVLPKGDQQSSIFAFDTGPGNMIIDEIVSLHTNMEQLYDDEGKIGKSGKVEEGVIEHFMKDPYYKKSPPKSTGREVYGKDFTQTFIEKCGEYNLSFSDCVATATAFTAQTIAHSYKEYILPRYSISKVLVCGGGALNSTLLEMIQQRLPKEIEVTTISAYGIPDQGREAMAFAIMGHRSLLGEPGNLVLVTGARVPVVLGTITL